MAKKIGRALKEKKMQMQKAAKSEIAKGVIRKEKGILADLLEQLAGVLRRPKKK